MLKGLLVLLIFQCLGEAISQLSDIPISGPIIGMLLLFLALQIYPHQHLTSIETCSTNLITHLPLLFLPAGVGIFFLDPEYLNQWPAIFVSMILGTILAIVITAMTMKLITENRHDK